MPIEIHIFYLFGFLILLTFGSFDHLIASIPLPILYFINFNFQFFKAVKYRQTRFGNFQSCGKRKRNIENRRCYRQCKKNSDCRGSKRKCLCDGECGMSCVRISNKYLYFNLNLFIKSLILSV